MLNNRKSLICHEFSHGQDVSELVFGCRRCGTRVSLSDALKINILVTALMSSKIYNKAVWKDCSAFGDT